MLTVPADAILSEGVTGQRYQAAHSLCSRVHMTCHGTKLANQRPVVLIAGFPLDAWSRPPLGRRGWSDACVVLVAAERHAQ